MPSPEAQAIIAALRAEPRKADTPDPPRDRADWLARSLADPPPAGTQVAAETWGGIACERVSVPGAGGRGLVLLLHGGAYVSGQPATHRKLAAAYARAAGAPVLVPEYRLAPEHPAPAAVEDALAVMAALQQDGPVALLGDSAGGGLAAALLLALRDAGRPLPAAALLLSPWTDILCRGESYSGNLRADPSMNLTRLRTCGRLYTGAGDPLDPLISPIEADLAGLPPMLVQVGGDEMMLDDSTVFAERVRQAGGEVSCEVEPGMWHVFQHFAGQVPEAAAAVARGGAFLRRHLGGRSER